MPCAPVNRADSTLLPESFTLFKYIVKLLQLPVRGTEVNLDPGFDSKRNRKMIWNAGMITNIKENPRNRDLSKPRRGRPRYFNIKSYEHRFTIERSFAWEDTYRALVVRYDRKLSHFMGHALLAYTLINLRHVIRRS